MKKILILISVLIFNFWISGSVFGNNSNEWEKYTNNDLWVFLNYPKLNYINWIPYTVKVQSDSKLHKITIFTEGNVPIKDYFKITFYVDDIKNYSDIEKIVKKHYWEWCVVNWLKYNNINWYYDIDIGDNSILRKKVQDWPICMKNWVSIIFYNKKINKVVYWNVWQESQFNFTWIYDSSFNTDKTILNSFKFINKWITNKIKIKSSKLISKDLILSKKDLEKTIKWRKYKNIIDNLVLKLSDKKLVSVYKKLEKINLNSKKIKKYKNILIYLQSKIWLEIWNTDWIKKEIIKNIISYKDNKNEFIKYNTDWNYSWLHEPSEERELNDIKILKKIWDFKLISYWLKWYDNVNDFKFKYQNSYWEKYYIIFNWEYSSYEPDIDKYKRYEKILNSYISYINFNDNDWPLTNNDLLFREELSKLYTFDK